jgi:hypothetical protein
MPIDPRAAPSPGDRLVVFDHRPEDPAIHRAAVRLAERLVGLVEPGLPGPEAPARALTEFDSAIRSDRREFARPIRLGGKAR